MFTGGRFIELWVIAIPGLLVVSAGDHLIGFLVNEYVGRAGVSSG